MEMADRESVPAAIPIVERLPSGSKPHPATDGLPEGTVGHPGEHLEHEVISHEGKVVGVPHEGYGKKVETLPSSEEVEKLLKEGTGESGHWLGVLRRKFQASSTK